MAEHIALPMPLLERMAEHYKKYERDLSDRDGYVSGALQLMKEWDQNARSVARTNPSIQHNITPPSWENVHHIEDVTTDPFYVNALLRLAAVLIEEPSNFEATAALDNFWTKSVSICQRELSASKQLRDGHEVQLETELADKRSLEPKYSEHS